MHSRFGNNVLITGASLGIGLASALLFAEKGFKVWGVSRSATSDSSDGKNIIMHRMDVTDDSSVASKIASIWEEAVSMTGRGISIIIHCAGMGIAGTAEETSHADATMQFETNYFGVLRVNRVLLPLMRFQGPSLVIVVGSVAGRICVPFQSHYSASKSALESYVEALRIEGRPFGIHATIIEPGDTNTGFTGSRRSVIPEDSPYAMQAKRSITKMEQDELHGASAKAVAKVIVRMPQKKRLPIRRAVGITYKLMLFAKRFLPDRLVELIVSKLYAS